MREAATVARRLGYGGLRDNRTAFLTWSRNWSNSRNWETRREVVAETAAIPLKSTHSKTSPEQIKASIVLDERTGNGPYQSAALLFYLQNAAKKWRRVGLGAELPMIPQ
jgi:hypothetical protein